MTVEGVVNMSKPLYSSASAIETADPKADGCFRKWWFAKRAKLPEIRKGSTVFGDVIHAVAERYLLADEHGMLDGKPVDLYPKDWDKPVNKWTNKPEADGISLEDQALIKDLIARAIEEGILMRIPGREIEKKISSWSVMEGVLINGFIDWLEPGAIRDHKSTKSMKWAKSVRAPKEDADPAGFSTVYDWMAEAYTKNALAMNIQINLYAYWYYTKGGYDKSLPLTVSHDYFVKDRENPHVEKRETQILWAMVNSFFKERIQPVLEMMLVYKDAEKHTDIPLPACTDAACRKFGGCPFVTICTEQETVKQYTARVEKTISGKNSTNYKQVADGLKKGEETMNPSVKARIEEMKKKAAAAKSGAATASKPEPKAKAEPTPAPVGNPELTPAPAPAEAVVDGTTAPWHREGCKSCSDNPVKGMKKDLSRPCLMCDSFRKRDGEPTSEDYIWEVDEGMLVVCDAEGNTIMDMRTNEEVTAKEVVTDEPAPAVDEVIEAPAEESVAEVQEAPEELEKAEKIDQPASLEAQEPPVDQKPNAFEAPEHNAWQTRENFILVIGAAVIESKGRGGGKFGSPSCRMSIEEFQGVAVGALEKEIGLERWGKMSHFEKRDAIGIYAEQIAAMAGKSTIVAAHVPKGSVTEALVQAIRPFANVVIEALRD